MDDIEEGVEWVLGTFYGKLTEEEYLRQVRDVRERLGVSEFEARAWVGWEYDESCVWSVLRGEVYSGLLEWMSGFEASELERAWSDVVAKSKGRGCSVLDNGWHC